jgi:hypothetical protein
VAAAAAAAALVAAAAADAQAVQGPASQGRQDRLERGGALRARGPARAGPSRGLVTSPASVSASARRPAQTSPRAVSRRSAPAPRPRRAPARRSRGGVTGAAPAGPSRPGPRSEWPHHPLPGAPPLGRALAINNYFNHFKFTTKIISLFKVMCFHIKYFHCFDDFTFGYFDYFPKSKLFFIIVSLCMILTCFTQLK